MTSDELRSIAQDWEVGGELHEALAAAAAEIDRLNSRVAELERDAKRWEFVRHGLSENHFVELGEEEIELTSFTFDQLSESDIDREVDLAMEAE